MEQDGIVGINIFIGTFCWVRSCFPDLKLKNVIIAAYLCKQLFVYVMEKRYAGFIWQLV